MDNICFDKTTFYTYLFLLGFFLCFTLYVYLYPKVNENPNPDLNLKQELMNEIQKVRAENSVQQINQRFVGPDRPMDRRQIDSRFLDKVFNPLHPPENIIPQGGFYNRGYNSYQDYQMLGFITNEQGQFPVYGRNKDNNNNRFEYYTINEGRNSIKIPFLVKGNAELYSGDPVKVIELPGQDFTFKKYENEGMRYSNLIQ